MTIGGTFGAFSAGRWALRSATDARRRMFAAGIRAPDSEPARGSRPMFQGWESGEVGVAGPATQLSGLTVMSFAPASVISNSV
jgi:hypothetical protein